MAHHGYDAFDDPYSYKNSHTLRNRLGLRDGDQLEAFELEMTTLRGAEPLPAGRLDEAHYRRVHFHLFQDVYSWAGKYRTVRTSKAGNMFCFPEHIGSEMRRVFNRLHATGGLETEDTTEFIEEVADFLAELNAIHPFREGNGRTQLAFVHLIGEAAGHRFEFSRVQPEPFMRAMIASYHGDLRPLTNELRSLLVLIAPNS